MPAKKHRINLFIPGDLDESLQGYADRLGISKTTLIGISVRAGLGTVVRIAFPEEALSASQWAAITAEMIKSGQPVRLPDGTIVGGEDA